MMIEQKKPYNEPCLTVLRTAPIMMLAASGETPEVHTTSEKASTSHEALVKDNNYDVWSDDWQNGE